MAMRRLPVPSRHTAIGLLVCVIVTSLFASIYFAFQQHIRSEADQPQVQVAQDVAIQLFNNQKPTVALSSEIDISKSLAPFVVLYDSNGRAADGTGKLNGKLPTPPKGVFEFTSKHVENRFTWQPADGLRVAAVVRYYQNSDHAGYVLAGRSLRESEKDQSRLLMIMAIGWAFTLLAALSIVRLQY